MVPFINILQLFLSAYLGRGKPESNERGLILGTLQSGSLLLGNRGVGKSLCGSARLGRRWMDSLSSIPPVLSKYSPLSPISSLRILHYYTCMNATYRRISSSKSSSFLN